MWDSSRRIGFKAQAPKLNHPGQYYFELPLWLSLRVLIAPRPSKVEKPFRPEVGNQIPIRRNLHFNFGGAGRHKHLHENAQYFKIILTGLGLQVPSGSVQHKGA